MGAVACLCRRIIPLGATAQFDKGLAPLDPGPPNPQGGRLVRPRQHLLRIGVIEMATVQVRYIVNDVDESIAFYCQQLGFSEVMHPAPGFAMLQRGDLRLVLSAPGQPVGGGSPMADGTQQAPGGWNRFAVEVPDISAAVARLQAAGAKFRSN